MIYQTLFWILIGIIVFIIFSSIITFVVIFWYISGRVFKATTMKSEKYKWDRNCSDPDDYEMMMMWQEGMKWANIHKDKKIDVSIDNDGCHLIGEFYNFNSNKTVILIGGRLESLYYSYYFAETFSSLKYNILLIDKRGHGLSSGGEIEDFGQVGYVDIIAWAKYLHEQFACNDITIHGICIGGTAGVFALTNSNCPNYVKRIVVDGLYTTLYDNFYHHMKIDRRPTFLITKFIMKRLKKIHHVSYIKDGPVYRIKNLKQPILFIYSDEDKFAPIDDSYKVYNACQSKDKQMVRFATGRHSHVRINNKNAYDKAIQDFLEKY